MNKAGQNYRPKPSSKNSQSTASTLATPNSTQPAPKSRISSTKTPSFSNSATLGQSLAKNIRSTAIQETTKPRISSQPGPSSTSTGIAINRNGKMMVPKGLMELYKVIDGYRIAEGYQVHPECQQLHEHTLQDNLPAVKRFVDDVSSGGKNLNLVLTKILDNDDNNLFHVIFSRHFRDYEEQPECTKTFEFVVMALSKLINKKPNYEGMFPTHFIGNYPIVSSLKLVLKKKIKITHLNERRNENIAHYFAKQAHVIVKRPGTFIEALYLFQVSGVKLNIRSFQGLTPSRFLLEHKDPAVVDNTKRALGRYSAILVGFLLRHELKDDSKDKSYTLRDLSWHARLTIVQMLAS